MRQSLDIWERSNWRSILIKPLKNCARRFVRKMFIELVYFEFITDILLIKKKEFIAILRLEKKNLM